MGDAIKWPVRHLTKGKEKKKVFQVDVSKVPRTQAKSKRMRQRKFIEIQRNNKSVILKILKKVKTRRESGSGSGLAGRACP